MYALIALQLITTTPTAPIIPIQHYHTVPTGRIYYGGHAGETSGVFVPTQPRVTQPRVTQPRVRIEPMPTLVYPRIKLD